MGISGEERRERRCRDGQFVWGNKEERRALSVRDGEEIGKEEGAGSQDTVVSSPASSGGRKYRKRKESKGKHLSWQQHAAELEASLAQCK